MALHGLNKGKRAEREVIRLLQPIVDEVYKLYGYHEPLINEFGKSVASATSIPQLQRNTMQSDAGGFDIAGLEWLALEVKMQEKGFQSKWWDQCVRQANENQVPVLLYRRNNVAWRVRMRGGVGEGSTWVPAEVDIDVETFLGYFRERLVEALSTSRPARAQAWAGGRRR